MGLVGWALALTVACGRPAADAEGQDLPYEEDRSVVPVPILAGRDLFLRVGLEANDPEGSRGVAVRPTT